MDSSKHSTTPWYVASTADDSSFDIDFEDLATNGVWTVASANNADDAAFIVRAVNSHDALIEALRGCLRRVLEECADAKHLQEVRDAYAALADAGA